jgi:hypothetical protein
VVNQFRESADRVTTVGHLLVHSDVTNLQKGARRADAAVERGDGVGELSRREGDFDQLFGRGARGGR